MTADSTSFDRRFLIVGLPRSGTTYLMSLLNSHAKVMCAGEVFNPYAVIGTGEPDFSGASVLERDWAPRLYLRKFFEQHLAEPWDRVGCKVMLGHNIRVLTYLPELSDVSIIYVHRANRLAQVASLLKALETKNWAQTQRTRDMTKKIVASPQMISHYWHEYATTDFLFEQWLATLPHHKMSVEYCEMFKPDFNARICDFLQIAPDPAMKSPLVKQGANRVLDRFQDPGPIEAYMRHIGRASWLEDELN